MTGARRHKPHPDGKRHEMTPEWKATVRLELDRRDVSEQWLADQVAKRRGMKSMKRDTINKMLNRQQSSSLVPDVCAILGIDPPMVATPQRPDEETRQILELLMRSSPAVKRAVLLLLLPDSKPT